MKVFVYRKAPSSERELVLSGVTSVEEDAENCKLYVHSDTLGTIELDTRYVKTTIFQN